MNSHPEQYNVDRSMDRIFLSYHTFLTKTTISVTMMMMTKNEFRNKRIYNSYNTRALKIETLSCLANPATLNTLQLRKKRTDKIWYETYLPSTFLKKSKRNERNKIQKVWYETYEGYQKVLDITQMLRTQTLQFDISFIRHL